MCLNMHIYICIFFLGFFQVLLQPIAEALLLLDRVMYLEENGASASLHKIFDDRISPRCFVTVAQKRT